MGIGPAVRPRNNPQKYFKKIHSPGDREISKVNVGRRSSYCPRNYSREQEEPFVLGCMATQFIKKIRGQWTLS
jgi:hypothetical protein